MVKDCLRGAPDPLLKEGEVQLAGAEFALNIQQEKNHNLQQRLLELKMQKQEAIEINKERREELTEKVDLTRDLTR